MAKINQTSNTVSLGKGRCQISEEQKRQLWQKVPQCQHSCSKTARLKVVKKKNKKKWQDLTLVSFYIHPQKQILQETQEFLLIPTLVITKTEE